MNKEQNTLPEAVPCNECHAGMMHARLITYFTWMNEELITVPNFPAWICDMCGKREYDEQAISWLTMLLDPNAGKPIHQLRRPHHTRPQARPSRPAPES